jgi:hypothetical protein
LVIETDQTENETMTDQAIVTRAIAGKGLLEISLTDMAYMPFAASLDGKRVPLAASYIDCAGDLIASGSASSRKIGETVISRGFTHILGSTVALTSDEAERLTAAFDASPAGITAAADRLDRNRLDLVEHLQGLEDDAYDARSRFIANDLMGTHPRDYTTDIGAARASLATFDAAHPEVAPRMAAAKEAEYRNNSIARGID